MGKDKIYGYTGKILRVELSGESVFIESTMKYVKDWLGGRGINMSILYSEVKPWTMPYEPANRIVIGAGPLTGTLAPGATRLSLASKNVFSYGVGTSNCGGHFAPELKFAGYDHIVVQGKARMPVYLWIDDDHIELRRANNLWGKTTWETDDLIKQDVGDENIQVLSIGPAGENLVRGACVIVNSNRAGGKCGLGAIMGSKNLKAIAVRGTGSIELAHPNRFMQAVDDARQEIEKAGFLREWLEIGTHANWYNANDSSRIPYKNFQDAHMPEESAKMLDPALFRERYVKKNIGYLSCPIPCSHFYRVDDGPYANLATEAFQLETSQNFGGKLAIEYPPAIIKAHALCNQLGLGMDIAAGAIAWAFECYQREIITEQDTDGLRLEWGDYGVVFELMRKMAYREGFGSILAEGCKKASEILGRDSEYYAIHMKGQDLYEEVRLPIGWGFGVCVATRGGGHTTGASQCESFATNARVADIAKKAFGIRTIDRDSYQDKAKLTIYMERLQEVVNSLGVCMFMGKWKFPAYPGLREFAELYSAGTGQEVTEDDFVLIADRIFNLEKAFNVLHADLSRKDDYPPDRCLAESVKSGPYKGFALSKKKYDQMLSEYYKLHGWDSASGLQTSKCLHKLGLIDVAQDLDRAHKLAVDRNEM